MSLFILRIDLRIFSNACSAETTKLHCVFMIGLEYSAVSVPKVLCYLLYLYSEELDVTLLTSLPSQEKRVVLVQVNTCITLITLHTFLSSFVISFVTTSQVWKEKMETEIL